MTIGCQYVTLCRAKHFLCLHIFYLQNKSEYECAFKIFCCVSVLDVLENSGPGSKLPTGHGATKQAVL